MWIVFVDWDLVDEIWQICVGADWAVRVDARDCDLEVKLRQGQDPRCGKWEGVEQVEVERDTRGEKQLVMRLAVIVWRD